MQATIAVIDGATDELSSLYSWLQRDDEFRGRVNAVAASRKPEDMGGATEMLTIALGSGGALAVLGATLSSWLSARRTKISVEIIDGDQTRRIEIDAANAATATQLFEAATGSTDQTS